ncbi:hypothetical protein T310_1157 [Rasamsonia emersonii CBS 393.64]|uniref:Uncharacterized protein n=1 Tax=Rasamsonia emersonii (strain ATCC 16479 / CBS 393.64 / IMI 116815) TaxID=1408163 RepID=A0A0F4Z4K0_RASE3|nr:hypothetical protein T310_1157 [Rasamsonia emersonii CBS 393.64]KKA24798.1 hypothetical protein T310_1157 [Rasamsonia emersonii CBS 393.64]
MLHFCKAGWLGSVDPRIDVHDRPQSYTEVISAEILVLDYRTAFKQRVNYSDFIYKLSGFVLGHTNIFPIGEFVNLTTIEVSTRSAPQQLKNTRLSPNLGTVYQESGVRGHIPSHPFSHFLILTARV